jgi:XTP/dITP diphosphohydrolase
MKKIPITYATRSSFKREEISAVLSSDFTFRDRNGDDRPIKEFFDFSFSDIQTDEPLEVDLGTTVRHKAVSAYEALLLPCIVEHAGLIFSANFAQGYPGGLTQPMMDALGAEGFLNRTGSAGEAATARAVFGYCDGMTVEVFVGETEGTIAREPRGDRAFYWDTIFQPSAFSGKTYAEITSERGVTEKMRVSQSFRALQKFLEHRVRKGANVLFYPSGP